MISFLTVAEVADRLRITPRVVRRLIGHGHLQAVQVTSRSLRIVAASVESYIDAHTVRVRKDDPRRAEAWSSH